MAFLETSALYKFSYLQRSYSFVYRFLGYKPVFQKNIFLKHWESKQSKNDGKLANFQSTNVIIFRNYIHDIILFLNGIEYDNISYKNTHRPKLNLKFSGVIGILQINKI